jgi:LysM repeat protein
MTTQRTPGRVVATALLAVTATTLGVAGLGALARALWGPVNAPGPSNPEEVVAALAAAAALALAIWLGLGLVVGILGHLPGHAGELARRAGNRWTPVVTQRLAAVLVGAVVGAIATPSSAVGGPGPVPPPGFAATASTAAGDKADHGAAATLGSGPGFSSTTPAPADPAKGTPSPAPTPSFAPTTPASASATAPVDVAPPGWTPTRPLVRPQASPELVTGRVAQGEQDGTVVVRRGDSLWAIAARHLGAGASDAEVARAWPRWYAANRDLIGDDPDLIHPGMVLQVPGSRTAVTR